MRELIFRGKVVEQSGGWVKGGIHKIGEKVYIIIGNGCFKRVDPETVGQFTGLTDVQKVDVYESDKVRVFGGEWYNGIWERDFKTTVVFIGGEFCCVCDKGVHYSFADVEFVEVIGNILTTRNMLR